MDNSWILLEKNYVFLSEFHWIQNEYILKTLQFIDAIGIYINWISKKLRLTKIFLLFDYLKFKKYPFFLILLKITKNV